MEDIAGARLEEIQDSYAFTPIDQPERTAALIAAFVRAARAKRSGRGRSVVDVSTPQTIPTGTAGFFNSLFDFSFNRLVATRVIKVLYVLLLVVIGLGLLGFLIAAIVSGSVGSILIALIVGPLLALLYIVYARILLEVLIAIFRILETNREIAFLQRQQLSLMQQQIGAGAPVATQPAQPQQYPYQPPQPPTA